MTQDTSKHHVHIEHVFRHEYGPLVASLLRRVGTEHLGAIEDAVQYAIEQALSFWIQDSQPANPPAWLYKVAYRKFLSENRNNKNRQQILASEADAMAADSDNLDNIPLKGEMNDALLQTLFQACHDTLPLESQTVFTLKCLCGFSVREIALRLFITEDNVYKRFNRAKKHLAQLTFSPINSTQIEQRLPSVHQIIYIIFTEGYLSSHPDNAIREDLCQEAIHLALMLNDSHYGNTPNTLALLALMHLHLARMGSRQTKTGALLLLEQQDRTQWNPAVIARGLKYLEQAATGEKISRFHIEASIAAEHCLAPSIEKTRWDMIVNAYELLEKLNPSPIAQLNKAIAIAEWQGPEAGLKILKDAELPPWLERSYHWHAVEADLLLRCNKLSQASESVDQAIKLAPTSQIKALLSQRLKSKPTADKPQRKDT